MAFWIRFSEDSSLPPKMEVDERKKLEKLFDPCDEASVWSRAARSLGFSLPRDKLISWRDGTPYINWSITVRMVSCGCSGVVPDGAGGFSYRGGLRLSRMPRLLKTQWKTAQYVSEKTAADCPIPSPTEDNLVESTALGLCMLALTLRLPPHGRQQFAEWMSNPQKAPAGARRVLNQMQAVQVRRTKLSPAWQALFPPRGGVSLSPAHFWDDDDGVDEDNAEEDLASQQEKSEWQGVPASAGILTGRVFSVRAFQEEKKDIRSMAEQGPVILVFPKARPETTELFDIAAAVLYGEGGVMSHACTVARERNIPCITGLGSDFVSAVERWTGKGAAAWISIDGSNGRVHPVREA